MRKKINKKTKGESIVFDLSGWLESPDCTRSIAEYEPQLTQYVPSSALPKS
jgi:hypothetical protein